MGGRPKRAWITAGVAAVVLAVVSASAVGAYTQEYNAYPSTCTNTWPTDCVAWPRLPNGQSVTTHVWLDSSLGSISWVDMGQDALDSFGRWNAVPANSPWLVQSTARSNATGYSLGKPTEIYAGTDDLADTTYGATTPLTAYQIGSGSDDHVILSFQTEFNSTIHWDHTLDFTCHSTPDPTDPCVYYADSRKVTGHEEGHGLGLGHSGTTAIMKSGTVTWYTVQTDDINGLKAIYGYTP